jgi:hypothetical protein
MRRVLSPNQRLWVISTLLVALLVRALIPAGFMPATDRPFSFQICPDGFPAALLQNPLGDSVAGPPAGQDAASHAGHHHEAGALAHVGHHHDAGVLTNPGHQDNAAALAHAGHQDDASALAHAGHHHGDDGALSIADAPLAAAHFHGGPLHNHGAASAEHCVFAAAAGVFALAFAATLSAPANSISAPEVDHLPPSFESLRFRLPQPRGPPALS